MRMRDMIFLKILRVFSMRKRLKTLGKMEFQVQKVLPGCLEKIRRYTKVLLEALLAEPSICKQLALSWRGIVVSTTININCRVQTDNTNLKIFHISEGRIKSFYTVSFCLKLQDDDGSRLYFSQGERVLLTAAQNQIVTIQSCLDNLQGLISSYSVENAVAALEDFMARGVSSSFYDRLQACLVIPDLGQQPDILVVGVSKITKNDAEESHAISYAVGFNPKYYNIQKIGEKDFRSIDSERDWSRTVNKSSFYEYQGGALRSFSKRFAAEIEAGFKMPMIEGIRHIYDKGAPRQYEVDLSNLVRSEENMVFLQCVSAGAMFEHFAIYPEGGFAVSGPGTTEHYFFIKSGRKIELKVITLQYLIQDLYSDDFLFATPGSIEFLDLSQTDILQYLMALPSNKMLQRENRTFCAGIY